MRYLEAPEEFNRDGKGLFLAGGITGCPNWQQAIAEQLHGSDWTLLNPRRTNFPIGDRDAAAQQIEWEYKHLRLAAAILFWFPSESLCPISLYELGTWSMTDKPLFVGVHSNYPRRQDIEVQTALVRPEIEIVYSLSELANQVLRAESMRHFA